MTFDMKKAHEISSRWAELPDDRVNESMVMFVAACDEIHMLHGQIATLKAALAKERVSKMKNSWPEWQNENKMIEDAISMLSNEMPDIFGDEKE